MSHALKFHAPIAAIRSQVIPRCMASDSRLNIRKNLAPSSRFVMTGAFCKDRWYLRRSGVPVPSKHHHLGIARNRRGRSIQSRWPRTMRGLPISKRLIRVCVQNDAGTGMTAFDVHGCSISSLSTVSIASIETAGTWITSSRSDCLNRRAEPCSSDNLKREPGGQVTRASDPWEFAGGVRRSRSGCASKLRRNREARALRQPETLRGTEPAANVSHAFCLGSVDLSIRARSRR